MDIHSPADLFIPTTQWGGGGSGFGRFMGKYGVNRKSVLRYIFGTNLEILTSIGVIHPLDNLKMGFILMLPINFTSRSKVNQPINPTAIGIFTKVYCTSVLNLFSIVWTDDRLWAGQFRHWHTDSRHTGVKTYSHRQWKYPDTKTGLG